MKKNISIILIMSTLVILLTPAFGFSNYLVGFALDSNVHTNIVDIDTCNTNANGDINIVDINTSDGLLPIMTPFSLDNYNNDEENDGDNEKKKFELHKGWTILLNFIPGFGLGTDIQIESYMIGVATYEAIGFAFGFAGLADMINGSDRIIPKAFTITGLSMFGVSKLLGIATPFLAESKPLWYSIILDIIVGMGSGSAFQGDFTGQMNATYIYSAVTMLMFPTYILGTLNNLFQDNGGKLYDYEIGMIIVAGATLVADRIYSIYRTVEVYKDPSKITTFNNVVSKYNRTDQYVWDPDGQHFPVAGAFALNIIPGFGLGTSLQVKNLIGSHLAYELAGTIVGTISAVEWARTGENTVNKIGTITGFSIVGLSRLFGFVSPFLVNSRPLWYSITLDVVLGLGSGSAFKGDVLGQQTSAFINLAGGILIGSVFLSNLIYEESYHKETQRSNIEKRYIQYAHPDGESYLDVFDITIIALAGATIIADRIYSVYRTMEVHNDPSKIVPFGIRKKDDNDNESSTQTNNNTSVDEEDEQTENNTEQTEDNAEQTEDNAEQTEDNAEQTEDNAEQTEDNVNDNTHHNNTNLKYVPLISISPDGGILLGFGIWF